MSFAYSVRLAFTYCFSGDPEKWHCISGVHVPLLGNVCVD